MLRKDYDNSATWMFISRQLDDKYLCFGDVFAFYP